VIRNSRVCLIFCRFSVTEIFVSIFRHIIFLGTFLTLTLASILVRRLNSLPFPLLLLGSLRLSRFTCKVVHSLGSIDHHIMSLFFYRGPKDRRRRNKDLDEDHCARLLRRAKVTRTWMHPKLTFEELIKNKTLPVRSLAPENGPYKS
jgi:hypothetical protein